MELISRNASDLLIGSLENFPKNRALLEQCGVKCLETCHHYKPQRSEAFEMRQNDMSCPCNGSLVLGIFFAGFVEFTIDCAALKPGF